ncbi:hypothetical protein B0H11DRAFT_2259905 [Mycena galericulata]|nr:hypothetical protein B0H11DRAFT_2259905 [Mycena galericulata]
MEDTHVQIMYPHLARRRRRLNPPPTRHSAQHTAEQQGPYGHGLHGANARPIVITRPAAYRQAPPPKRSSADQALRDNDAKLLARLAESRARHNKAQETKRSLKRRAGRSDSDETPANKRAKTDGSSS